VGRSDVAIKNSPDPRRDLASCGTGQDLVLRRVITATYAALHKRRGERLLQAGIGRTQKKNE
jgi:hypothetical protein